MAAWLNSRPDQFDSVPGCFRAQAGRVPDALAVSDSETRLTYRELDERANRLAHRLLGMGVGPEDPVAVLVTRSADVVVSFLAVLKAGGCYLPLHDAYPIDRMQWIVDDVGAKVLLTDRAAGERGLPQVPQSVVLDEDPALPSLSTADPGIRIQPDQLAYVMYTSGSTGHPKGVAVTHRGVLCLALDSCWDSGAHERVAMVAPYAFGVSTYEVWVPLLHGGHVLVSPPGDLDVGELVRTGRITGLHLTAGLFRVLADMDPGCLAGVREVMTGGDVISPAAVRRVLEACPDITVRALYGGTEVSSFATSSPMRAPYTAKGVVPVGRPMDDVRFHVLDGNLRPVPDGEVGDLYIAGTRLARGYLGRPELTAERYVADPFGEPGARMYRTGDLARWNEQRLIEFAGRAGDQVKIRGFRVEPGEVEAAIAAFPGLAQIAVVARDVEPDGKQLVAYYVPEPAGVDVDALRAHSRSTLPDYMVPAAWVALDALPLTPNGKLDRKALPDPPEAGAAVFRPPGTPRQETLCALFAEVLEVERVGLDDSFFDLDGQSLLAMRLIGRIKSTLGLTLTIGDLFDAPTVAQLDTWFDHGRRQQA